MPKKDKIKNQSVCIPFKYIWETSLVSGFQSRGVDPASWPRVSEIADTYDTYRIKRLSFRLQSTTGASIIAGYYPGGTDNPPASVVDISENLKSCYLPSTQTKPSDWVHLKMEDIMGYVPWYKTVAGSVDPVLETPGTLYFRGTGTNAFVAEFRGEYEFRGAANIGATPAARAQAQQAAISREKKRILAILSADDTASLGVGQTFPKGSVPSTLGGVPTPPMGRLPGGM
jgi:hypothetical protein